MSAPSLVAGVVLPLILAQAVPQEQVRIRTKHANIQAGPTSGADVLVLAPRGTVLTVIERKGPWVTVELRPELRKTATPMRWYKNETRGFVHDSQVETSAAKPVKEARYFGGHPPTSGATIFAGSAPFFG